MASSNLPHPEARAERASKDAPSSSSLAMTYAEFWPRYLRAHRDPRTKALHFVGTSAGVAMLLAAAVTRDWRWLIAGPVVGYGCAWVGHAVFERNKPETFGHPFWSLYSDFRMLALFLAGRLKKSLPEKTP
ncbi:MAG TPA: DUF962 domain-containing protein [Stellaceae bacterium]|nr:DUF962 domain-containing protein [Stellaceae bacterium]